MGLKLDITDSKGVKVRYHKIKSFEYNDGVITVKLYSYVNQSTRDAEKTALANNATYMQYEKETEELRNEVNALSARLSEGETELADEVIGKSNILNDRTLKANRPAYEQPVDKHYIEDEVELTTDLPITLESLYVQLTTDGKYKDAETI